MDNCLIVGAGMIGLSIAYELAKSGQRVRVLDRGEPGQEASWAGAGILPPANFETAVDPLEQLRGLSFRLHSEWARRLLDETGIDTGYRRCGGIYLACSPGECASLVAWAQLLLSINIAVERLSPAELVRLEPALQPISESGRLRGSWHLPEEAQVRNPWHLRALLAACRQHGVAIENAVEVQDISSSNGQITALATAQGIRTAEQYCFCSGAWTHGLMRKVGIDTGVFPIRGQMVLFRSQSPIFQSPIFRRVLNSGSRYLVPRDDGRVLAGSTEEEVGFDKTTTTKAIQELTEFAIDVVPELRRAEVERTWAGLRPGSFDGFPYLGAIPGLQNAYLAAGHFRSGVLLSTGTALVMGQLIRGEQPVIDLSPFSVSRG